VLVPPPPGPWVSPPLRPSHRRWESGETPDPRVWRVYSSVGCPGGAVKVVVAELLWSSSAGGSSPSRWCSLWCCRWSSGRRCSEIGRSVELLFSKDGLRCVGEDRLMEFLSLALVFVSVWWILAMPWRCWGPATVRFRCVFRRGVVAPLYRFSSRPTVVARGWRRAEC
jgi:hypothetical protein